jgi:glycosyltransferase involved in cell wall biosynthesis
VKEPVVFTGFQRDVRSLLWQSSLFVLLTHREAKPLALVEAMAGGLACVASEVGEIPTILAGGEAGCLVPASGSQKAGQGGTAWDTTGEREGAQQRQCGPGSLGPFPRFLLWHRGIVASCRQLEERRDAIEPCCRVPVS